MNSRGDIVSIYNVAGGEVVQYTYDAYGKVLSTAYTQAYYTIAELNPLIYRGYVYDRETGLYYLQSRYYDPVTCRFVNGDSQLNIDSFNGFNQFAYCNGNPVVNADPNGMCMQAWAAGYQGPCPGFGKPGCMYFSLPSDSVVIKPIRDVTEEIDVALVPIIENARNKKEQRDSMFFCDRVVLETFDTVEFYFLVHGGAPWDIKLPEQWENTIGTTYPSNNIITIYRGVIMTPQQLGNFTYGAIGKAYGFPQEAILLGSYYAAGCPLFGEKLVHELFEDQPYVLLGYYACDLLY